ncbi:hypothetical protein Rhopal_005991-T1 [Rhodotorula paludigena]|uniref:Uncharacterized protein n=1 Tax=Rhodotorula paludigena TaxID=86838 RepID=A0AAV5GV76_9BASI|nr:hypothetical protein Rhopal_005991-T1 [Rhodotorula paludigena]
MDNLLSAKDVKAALAASDKALAELALQAEVAEITKPDNCGSSSEQVPQTPPTHPNPSSRSPAKAFLPTYDFEHLKRLMELQDNQLKDPAYVQKAAKASTAAWAALDAKLARIEKETGFSTKELTKPIGDPFTAKVLFRAFFPPSHTDPKLGFNDVKTNALEEYATETDHFRHSNVYGITLLLSLTSVKKAASVPVDIDQLGYTSPSLINSSPLPHKYTHLDTPFIHLSGSSYAAKTNLRNLPKLIALNQVFGLG